MAKNKIGRPTKYDEKYCEMLIEHMEQGLSYESFAGIVSVSKETIYAWERKHKEFLDAKKIGFAKCQVFWEKQGLGGLYYDAKRPFNTGNWIFQMKNRFKWTDKVEVSGGDEDSNPIMLNYKLDK